MRDPIYFLVLCTAHAQLRRELARRKVAWQPESPTLIDSKRDRQIDEALDADPASLLAEVISRAVTEEPPGPPPQTEAPITVRDPAPRPPRGPLPDLNDVQPRPVADGPYPAARTPSGGSRGTPSWWMPRDEQDRDEDRELGRRGEELVLRHLQDRLREAGQPPELAVWVADAQPLADHDIRTADADGQTLWVEVKATTGRHGRFHRPRAEFQLALRTRDRYLLYRVYGADTRSPTLWEVRDPIGAFRPANSNSTWTASRVTLAPCRWLTNRSD